MDNNLNTAVVNNESVPDLSHVVIVHEAGADKSYKLEDAKLGFDVAVTEDGTLKFKKGKLITSYLIQNTELESLESWRFFINNIKFTGIHISAYEDLLTYEFEAEDFIDYTAVSEE